MNLDAPLPAVPATAVKPRFPKLVAVVDIGATSIRMAIAEITEGGQFRTLETVAQAVSLGRDTFSTGAIDPATTEECVRVLKNYRQLLNEYDITRPEQIHVVATSAVREAVNRLSFLKRIYIATGFNVEPFDEAAVNRVTYLGVLPLLASEPRLAEAQTLIVEVGGGSTEALLIDHGDVAFAHTYRLGALRLRKTLEAFHAPAGKVRAIMESQIARIVDQVRKHVPADQSLILIALGGDIRFATAELLPSWDAHSLATLPVGELRKFTEKIVAMSVDEILHRFHLAVPDAESVGPALLTYARLARALSLDELLVSPINLRDGLIKELASREEWTENFTHQIVRSAVDFGRRFGFDEPHGRQVAELSRMLFRALQPEHQLGYRHEVILYVAALLHDVGYAVSARSHHKHSMYLISNGDLFGLSQKDVQLAALIARYHRRSSPKPIHESYATLDWESRTQVVKLAAILRLADALDRNNNQRIKGLQCTREDGRWVISVPGADDLSVEQLAVQQKAGLFKEVYGMPVLVRNAPERLETKLR
ncbi:MAG: Ppx/GppA family phosphatase [Candidatus Anammoximicrobium sp.]|nr:Ppx/GppA family phosphatase [Candidatus Anammoximicrobium sp.]